MQTEPGAAGSPSTMVRSKSDAQLIRTPPSKISTLTSTLDVGAFKVRGLTSSTVIANSYGSAAAASWVVA